MDVSNQVFRLQIFSAEKSDIYLSSTHESVWSQEIIWPIIKELDNAGIRVVGDISEMTVGDPDRTRRIIRGCAGILSVLPFKSDHQLATNQQLINDLEIAVELGIPVAVIKEKGVTFETNSVFGIKSFTPIILHPQDELKAFVGAVLKFSGLIRPYAFFIGRLERDFCQAREAIKIAVENEAGIPCLWIDDGRHKTNIKGIRESTQLLIKNAEFVIADLTLGTENPKRENPSRAHEIGLAMAFDKPVLLCSQGPRRVPYYSISDLQMFFWNNEEEIGAILSNWISMHKENLGRTIYNYQLDEAEGKRNGKIGREVFNYDPELKYVGPKTD